MSGNTQHASHTSQHAPPAPSPHTRKRSQTPPPPPHAHAVNPAGLTSCESKACHPCIVQPATVDDCTKKYRCGRWLPEGYCTCGVAHAAGELVTDSAWATLPLLRLCSPALTPPTAAMLPSPRPGVASCMLLAHNRGVGGAKAHAHHSQGLCARGVQLFSCCMCQLVIAHLVCAGHGFCYASRVRPGRPCRASRVEPAEPCRPRKPACRAPDPTVWCHASRAASRLQPGWHGAPYVHGVGGTALLRCALPVEPSDRACRASRFGRVIGRRCAVLATPGLATNDALQSCT